jgi:hypothetical protein
MGYDAYLNNVNHIIGENARFARQYQSNSQSASGQSQSSSTQSSNTAAAPDSMMAMLNPMIMLMLFQLLSQMMPGLKNSGLPLGNMPYPSPLFPDPTVNNSVPLQNPAYQFINNLLTGANAPSTSGGVDFTDNASILSRINSILADSKDPTMQYFASMVTKAEPDSVEFQSCKLRIDALMQQEGRDTGELDLLIQALQFNPVLNSLNTIEANTHDSATAARINAMTQMRTDLANQWMQAYGPDTPDTATTDGISDANLVTSVKTALQQGKFTEAQLGQSLKYMLDKAPDSLAGQAGMLLMNLMESGDLNVSPFLTNDYLSQLSPDRRQLLLESVEMSGLRMANGKPNSRFIGFMLDQLNRSDNPTTQQFLHQFLQDFYDVHGSNPTTPVGDTLASILKLAGIQADQDGQLVFA